MYIETILAICCEMSIDHTCPLLKTRYDKVISNCFDEIVQGSGNYLLSKSSPRVLSSLSMENTLNWYLK